jgi:hypothetical protein
MPYEICHHRCKRQLCLAHRSYTAHDCDGANAKDMTSIDCPICGKSVKFAKSQLVDDVWNEHYLNECTKKPVATKAAPKKCANASCPVLLNLSNTFTCKKCNKEVCLTHRASEDHVCKSVASAGRQAFLDRFSSSTPATTNPPSGRAKTASGKAKAATVDPSNTLKGTAERRRLQGVSAPVQQLSSTSASFVCPFCIGLTFSDPGALQTHVTTAHPEPGASTSSTGSSRPPPPPPPLPAPSQVAGREVCPVCNQRFMDPVALVSHFGKSANYRYNNKEYTTKPVLFECHLSMN